MARRRIKCPLVGEPEDIARPYSSENTLPNNDKPFLSTLWAFRAYQDDDSYILDLFLILFLIWFRYQGALLTIGIPSLYMASYFVGREVAIRERSRASRGSSHTESARPDVQCPLPPMLIPARTTHSRFVPRKHSFSYSYLYVGIPVGWAGRSGRLLSADVELLLREKRQYGWFNINSADYLSRNPRCGGLYAKLQKYLRSQGVGDDDWASAFLCTAPRFLGYSFNPVSFWYIYNSASVMTMMVLEVNNTFDERRMYLLKADQAAAAELEDGIHTTKFKEQWAKDFHVSPFNSTLGSYSLQATNPRESDTPADIKIDNTITLQSSKGEIKLVARAFSVGPVQEAAKVEFVQGAQFILAWCWVGFLTFPRILFEAYRLYFSRKLHVWFRPEVLQTSIGRRTTAEERKLEVMIRRYLRDLVLDCDADITIKYIPPDDIDEPETWQSRALSSDTAGPRQHAELRVLTPAFYSRFVHYAHTKEALDREGLCADDKSRTILISKPELLDLIIPNGAPGVSLTNLSLFQKWRWKALRRLRCPPPAMSYPEVVPEGNSDFTVNDIRSKGFSSMDRHVLLNFSANDSERYRRRLSKQFIAQRYAFGFTGLVSIADWTIRLLLIECSLHFPPASSVEQRIATTAAMLATWSLIHL